MRLHSISTRVLVTWKTSLFAGIGGRGCQMIRAEKKNGIARESRTELPEREDADEVRHAD